MPLVLGAALGPDAVVVQVRDAATGDARAAARVAHADVGGNDDDPAAWWRALVTAIDRAGQRDVAAMSVTGDHPGLVLLDEAGAVLRPVRPWDVADDEVARVRQALGAERWARRAGLVPDATTPVTRLAWLHRTDPRSFNRIGTVLLPHEWLTYRLAGRPITDGGSASGTGLWSPHTGSWIPDALALLAPEGRRDEWARHLPVVLSAGERGAWLDAHVFDQLGLRGRPVVAPGTAAPMATALALDLGRGDVGIALRSETTVVAPLDTPIVDPTGAVTSRADATDRHLAVATVAGGAALVTAVANLLGVGVDALGAAALSAPDPDDELFVLPTVDGRSGAVVTGVGAGATREALARATFEGTASAALAAVESVIRAGARWFEHEPLHLAGPPEALLVHARALASLAGRAVVATPGDAAAAGACVQAAAVLGDLQPAGVARAWGLGRGTRVEPVAGSDGRRRRAAHAQERARHARRSSP